MSLLCFSAVAHAAQTLVLKNAQDQYKLMEHLEFLKDPDGVLTIDDVAAPSSRLQFETGTGKNRNFGYSNAVFWARLHLENRSSEKVWLVLAHRSGVTAVDHIDLYTPMPVVHKCFDLTFISAALQ